VTDLYLPASLAPTEVRPLDAGFFEASARHQLTVQRCVACGAYQHPPREACPSCHSFELEWSPVPGTGEIYSYTVVHHPGALPAYVPYTIVLVLLDVSGTRLISNLIADDPADLRVGRRVEVVWEDVSDGITLARFRPTAV
jgi:uncharacterized OB-fold protein